MVDDVDESCEECCDEWLMMNVVKNGVSCVQYGGQDFFG